MIDTEQVNNIKQPLQLINVDFKHFVKNNQPIMQKYIDSLEQPGQGVNRFLPKELSLGLDEDGYLVLSLSKSTENKKRYGIKKSVQQIYRRGNETNADWAKRVMINYRNWLRPIYKEQQNIVYDNHRLRYATCRKIILFTNRSYANWIINHIDEISGFDIENDFIYDQHEYLLESFIANYNQYKTIHQCLLRKITEYHLDNERKFKQHPAYYATFVQELLDILNNKNNAPQLIFTRLNDEHGNIDYDQLLTACQKLNVSVNELPIEALVTLFSKENVDSKLKQIKFTVRDLNDIKVAINAYNPENYHRLQKNIKDLHITINLNGYKQAIHQYINKLVDQNRYDRSEALKAIFQLIK